MTGAVLSPSRILREIISRPFAFDAVHVTPFEKVIADALREEAKQAGQSRRMPPAGARQWVELEAKYRELVARGLTIAEAADELRVSRWKIKCDLMKIPGLQFRPGRPGVKKE